MTPIYLSIGSNIDRERSIRFTVGALQEAFGALEISTVYESAAVGFAGENFYNLVVGFESALSRESIQEILHQIEEEGGRERGAQKFTSRTVDIDLLLYGDLDLQAQSIDLPRAEIFQYAFVLRPLAEIAGGRHHPQTRQTYAEIWAQFDQSSQPLWEAALQFDQNGQNSRNH